MGEMGVHDGCHPGGDIVSWDHDVGCPRPAAVSPVHRVTSRNFIFPSPLLALDDGKMPVVGRVPS